MKIQWGSLNAPLGTPMGLPKTTARVDSRLKLTFGQLVSKSTYHVWQVDQGVCKFTTVFSSRCRVRVRVMV